MTDPSLPVEDVVARLNSSFIGYYRALDFFGRSANFTVTAPYFWGTGEGLLEGEPQSISRSGMADLQFRFSANLLGGQAMNILEFQDFRKNPRTMLGVSIRIQPPTGQYDSDRLVNLGTNRRSFKPRIDKKAGPAPGGRVQLCLADSACILGFTGHDLLLRRQDHG